jgi:farnesyl diphosphate synthase
VSALPFAEWMAAPQDRAETALGRFLPGPDSIPARLHDAMRYATLGGGKRVRPLLAFAAGELTGATAGKLDIVACAVEMIHAYSLVHDDLPCMDDDVLRRGRPTCHVEYDEPTALLVGDSLQTWPSNCSPASRSANPAAAARNDRPARPRQRLARHGRRPGHRPRLGRQAAQPARTGTDARAEDRRPDPRRRAARRPGRPPLSADERSNLDRFAKRAGLLFQVVDDILDCTASTATLGKTAGKDEAADKPTYVSLLGLERRPRLRRRTARRCPRRPDHLRRARHPPEPAGRLHLPPAILN